MKPQVCDVIFFKTSDTFISKFVSKITSSPYTHVGIVVKEITDKDNYVIIMEADRFINTRQRVFKFDPALHALYRVPLTLKQGQDIVSFCLSMEGKGYDYLQLVGLFIRLVFKLNMGNLFNRTNYLICSELIDKAFYVSGVRRKTDNNIGDITPKELLKEYEFTSLIKDTQSF